MLFTRLNITQRCLNKHCNNCDVNTDALTDQDRPYNREEEEEEEEEREGGEEEEEEEDEEDKVEEEKEEKEEKDEDEEEKKKIWLHCIININH